MKVLAPPSNETRPGASRTKAVPGHRLVIDLAARLSESDLVMVGRLPASVAMAGARRDFAPGQPRFLILPSRPAEADPRTNRVLIHWRLQRDLLPSESMMGTPALEIVASDVLDRTVTLQELAREGLAWHDPQTRAEVLEFLLRATAAPASPRRSGRGGSLFSIDRELRLSASLHALREALRERLPVSLIPDGPMALIDAVVRIDRDAFFLCGRIRAGTSTPVRVTAVSPEGSRVEILDRAYWYDLGRPGDPSGDGVWKGFAVFLTCAASFHPGGWVLEVETKSGELLEVGAPKVAVHTHDAVRILLEQLAIERLPTTSLRTGQIVPAVRRLQRARQRAAKIETVRQFGVAPASPTVSVIVPLYKRIDLIEHQMTQFADDPGFRRSADLIYVLDSPELEDELMESSRRLFALYRQPFRVAVLSANVGFACANNFGASIAEGRIILLLNSDVFPESPDWLDAMVRFHDSLPNPGAIGPKLLYEDDTLQHAGMFFERLSETQPWSNEHYFKGMHRDLPAAAESRPVPAVTGGCMMIAKDLYLKMGGLSGDYLQGDFEDSDLCLRLLEAGRQNWYFADAALYHLEASSYDPSRRRLHEGFNRWLHTHLWSEQLAALGGPELARVASTTSPAVAPIEIATDVAVEAPAAR